MEKELATTRDELEAKTTSYEELNAEYQKLKTEYNNTAATLESYEGTEGLCLQVRYLSLLRKSINSVLNSRRCMSL